MPETSFLLVGPVLLGLSLVVGAVAGSHVGLVAERLPRGEAWVAGRSRCRACGATLAPHELLPLLSYVLQGGRCRRCGAPIPIDLIWAEAGGAAVSTLALWSAPTLPAALAFALFGWTLLLLALLDWRHLWLPDRITVPLAVAGLLATLVAPGIDLVARIAGLVVGYGALTAIRLGYRAARGREGLGRGDAKLLGAIGAWLGWQPLPMVVLAAALIALAAVLVAAIWGKPPGQHDAVPFGTPLAIAACLAIAWMA